jgi:hypothetical protein
MFTVSIETYEKFAIALYTLHHKKKYNNGNHNLKISEPSPTTVA